MDQATEARTLDRISKIEDQIIHVKDIVENMMAIMRRLEDEWREESRISKEKAVQIQKESRTNPVDALLGLQAESQ